MDGTINCPNRVHRPAFRDEVGGSRRGFFVTQQQRPRRNLGLASGERPRLYYVHPIA